MCKKRFATQLRLMQHSIGYQFAFFVILILCLSSTLQTAIAARELTSMEAPTPAFAFVLRSFASGNELFRQLYVFLLVFPFCLIPAKTVKLGMDSILITRTNTRTYCYTNLLTAFLGTFLCFLIPLLIQLLINEIVFPANLDPEWIYGYSGAEVTGDNVFANTIQKGVPFLGLYIRHPNLYNVLYALLFSAFCGLFAMLVQSISAFIRRFSILLFLPVYLITFIQSRIDAAILYQGVKQETPYLNCNMTDYVFIDSFYGKSKLYITALILTVIAVTVVLTELQIRRRA